MTTRIALLVGLIGLLVLPGCQRRGTTGAPAPGAGDDTTAPTAERTTPTAQRAQASRRPPVGATCGGREDCTSDQVCVEARCQYRATAVSGEILVSAAEAQARAGDWAGAIETYDLAFERYREADAPVPPEVACGAAELILRTATDADARERGARRADHCFRITVPGHPLRDNVRRALARLRFDGLTVESFDGDTPAPTFFDPSAAMRPTVENVAMELEMPDLDPREPASHTAVREVLRGEAGQRAIAECFIQDWEVRHDRDASATLTMRYSTRLIDMGGYDVYQPQMQVEPTTDAVDGFEPCLAAALPTLFTADNRSIRGEPWTQSVVFSARIQ